MFCNYDDNSMKLEYIDVIHSYNGTQKKYYDVPRYKCRCGYAKMPISIYKFMDKNIDNDIQYSK